MPLPTTSPGAAPFATSTPVRRATTMSMLRNRRASPALAAAELRRGNRFTRNRFTLHGVLRAFEAHRRSADALIFATDMQSPKMPF